MLGRRSDIQLLKASLRGRPQAFGVLVGRYQSLVCAITYSATGDVHKSEELAQETFLQAWKSLAQLRDLDSFRPWLCQIARSTVQNFFRSQKRDIAPRIVALEAAADRASEESGPMEAAMSREEQVVVSRALAQLPESLREPLILFYRQQQSVRQVALQFGLSENAARQRISRARALLRAQVASTVETAIARSKPGKAFKTAVIAALATTAVKTTTTATAAGLLSTLTGKVALAAAGIALAAGVVWVHQRATNSDPAMPMENAVASVSPVAPVSDPVPSAAENDTANPERTLTATYGTNAAPAPAAPQVPAAAPASDPAAAPFEFKPTGVLSGRITDSETGEPIPDARVCIACGLNLFATTNAQGVYCFEKVREPGNFYLSVDTLTHVAVLRHQANRVLNLSDDKQMVQHFSLPKAAMADVWVVDQNGVGIPDAMVVVTSLLDDRYGSLGAFADNRRTDAKGYTIVGGIAPGQTDYLVTAWHSIEGDREGDGDGVRQHLICNYAPGKAVVQLPDPNVIPEVTIVLAEGKAVVAGVEYADGIPAAGVRLSLIPRWWHCSNALEGPKTDEGGTLTFDHVVPGSYDISWDKPFPGGVTLAKTIMQAELPPEDGGPLLIRLPENAPQSLVSIRGTITFLGEGIPDSIGVTASSTAGLVFGWVGPQADGAAEFEVKDLVPGTYNLDFTGRGLEDQVVRDVAAPTDDLVVEMVRAARPRLRGTVLDAGTGEPISRFQARVRKLQTLRGMSYVQQDRWTQFDEAQGRFDLETVGPGVYEVQVQAEGYAPRWSELVNTDELPFIQMPLTVGGTILGRVTDEEGKAVSRAKVVPLSRACGTMSQTKRAFVNEDGAVETADGLFRLDHLPAGRETLKVSHPDYAVAVVEDIAVREGEATEAVQIVLSQGATVEGWVYDGEGRPQAGATLVFQDAEEYPDPSLNEVWQLATVVTDSNGFYRVTHLPEKPCHVSRRSGQQHFGVTRRTLVPRADQVMRLDLGGTPIVAGVLMVDGVAQANASLRLYPADPMAVRTFSCCATTDAEGAFAFNGVIAGTHTICYRPAGQRTTWLPIATVEVADRDVNLGVIPAGTATLKVTIETPETDPAWTTHSLILAEIDRPTVPARIADPPEAAGGPWGFDHVVPGEYKVVVRRSDNVEHRLDVTLDPGAGPWTRALALPPSTAGLSGCITGFDDAPLAIWCEDRSVLAGFTRDPDGHFELANLPAGRYGVGPVAGRTYPLPPLGEFTLAAGENRVLNLDLAGLPEAAMTLAFVQVLDEAGNTRRDVRLWLDTQIGRVEPLDCTVAGHALLTYPGRSRLHVEAPGYPPVERDVTIEPTSLFGYSLPTSIAVGLRRP